jgi:hypothetical protein
VTDLDAAALHPGVDQLRFLLGTWTGEGIGQYPTIDPFGYGEEIRFSHVGKPFLAYSQRTWSLDDGRPLHSETGFWRSPAGGRVELVMAHPNGLVEIEEGTVAGATVELASCLVGGTSTAKQVTSLCRRLAVVGDELSYTLDMAAVGVAERRHLGATLRRLPAR